MAESKENKPSSIARSGKRLSVFKTPFSSRKYTPYGRTPKTARSSRLPHARAKKGVEQQSNTGAREVLKDSRNLPPSSSHVNRGNVWMNETPKAPKTKRNTTEVTEDITSIVGKTWRVYRCSPLYNFHYEKTALQGYNMLLSCHLQLASSKETAFEIQLDNFTGKLKAEFSILNDLVLYDTDYLGVKITVSNRTSTSSKDAQPLFTAVLCCIGNELQDNELLKQSFTSLPVCLVKGSAAITKSVLSWLEVHFDCKITPLGFPPSELSWYASLWAGIVPNDSSHNLELCYSVPTKIKGLNRITFSVNANDAKELWDCNHNNNSAIFTEEESVAFIKSLEIHFYHHFKINLTPLSLCRVANSVVFIGSEGRIKLLQAEYVRHVLQQITVSAAEQEACGRL